MVALGRWLIAVPCGLMVSGLVEAMMRMLLAPRLPGVVAHTSAAAFAAGTFLYVVMWVVPTRTMRVQRVFAACGAALGLLTLVTSAAKGEWLSAAAGGSLALMCLAATQVPMFDPPSPPADGHDRAGTAVQ